MSKLLCVLLVCAVVAASAIDTETDLPAGKPRRGRALKGARKVGPSYGSHQKVVIVPKGDPRAQAPPEAPKPVDPTKEQRIIVEADVFESPAPAPVHPEPYPNEIFPTPTPTATPTPTPAVVPGASRVLRAVAPASAGACLRSWNGATAAAKAAAYQTNYKSRGVRYSQPQRQFGITATKADCSSFVTSILNDIGMNCLFAAGRYTAYMNEQIRARGGYKQVAKAGDIVMWGSHTGMIVKVCSPTTYSMVAMGNSGAGRAECKTVDGLKGWGSGGWLGFWIRARGGYKQVAKEGGCAPFKKVEPPAAGEVENNDEFDDFLILSIYLIVTVFLVLE